jgi:hypothetical protein
MDDKTVIYYSSNTERVKFESRIQADLWQAKGNLPLISVTQRPMRFGENICVGEVGACEDNLYRQILVGAQAAKTPFVIMAEADSLYPKEYFQITPDSLTIKYFIQEVYILYPQAEAYFLKARSDVAMIIGREFLISLLSKALEGRTPWKNNETPIKIYNNARQTSMFIHDPIVSVKTTHGMRPKTQCSLVPVPTLPYWGSAHDQIVRLFHD